MGSRRFSLLFCTGCSRVHDGSRGVPGNDSYEARGTECGYRGFGKIAPELLVAKGAIDNSLRKPAERVGGLSLRPMTRPQNGGSVGLASGLLWFSGRQNPLDGCFHCHSRFIQQSDYIFPRVPSLAGLTNEHPQPSCFGSQLVGVHLLERSFLVAHGGGPIQISPRFSLFLATHFYRPAGNTLRESPGSALAGLPSSDTIRFQWAGAGVCPTITL